jgi:hypothetical protein
MHGGMLLRAIEKAVQPMLIDIHDQRKQNISLERSTPIRQTAVSLPITFLKEMQMLTVGGRIPTFRAAARRGRCARGVGPGYARLYAQDNRFPLCSNMKGAHYE